MPVLMKDAIMLPQNIFRKYITCLSPTVGNKDWTILAIGRLAERFSHVTEEQNVSVIKDP